MKKIITISREFGSGGREIGKKVAEALGYRYYDVELIEKIANETGLSEKYIEENGEYAKGKNIFSYAFLGRTVEGKSVEDYIWEAQRSIIRELAEKESCVIVGRCADFILKDNSESLHVFVHADFAYRKNRRINLYGEKEEGLEKRIHEVDKKRSTNYKYYTERTWGNVKNYHICLDSSVFGVEKCVEFICEIAEKC